MRFELEGIRFAYRSKAFGILNVFSDLTLTVRSGESVAIVGEEGSGKSTLLQLLDGLLRPDAGTVRVDQKNVWDTPERMHLLRRRIGFAFQFPESQFFCESVREELLFTSRNFGLQIPTDDELYALFKELGLSHSILLRSPFSLSMGEARRVAFASILLHRPDSLLLDEPTAGLDASGIERITAILNRLHTEGRTVVLASHDDSFSSVAQRVIMLEGGKVAREYSPT